MSEGVLVAVIIIGMVVLATALQRVTGMGFAMMLAPFLVVMVGPHSGVMLANVLGGVAPLLMLPMVWRYIEWRRLLWIAPAAVAVMPLFGWIAAIMPQGPLYIVVASAVIIGLSISLLFSRSSSQIDGTGTRLLTGVGAGAGVVLAGVGGPAMTVYAVISRWGVVSFAATMQPLWVLLSVTGLLTKVTFSGSEFPQLPVWFWVGSLAAVIVGLFIGTKIRNRVSERLVRRVVIALAFLGAVLSLATGITTTVTG
ncbi:sulfite exporter TauE/SafE family protein [Nesterenkonia rhizosphaerae]|uniref:Probable membrane transporter protein n=1 Tax=Nesterenkonia rhizosphaerae TaxID=1348272 RepID=A0ABP9FU21_9MICC